VLSGVAVSVPSLVSVVWAWPRFTGVVVAVASVVMSLGGVICGGTLSVVGSVFWVYSSRLFRPSPSRSWVASVGFVGFSP